jgi:hypothetical protein
MDKKNYNRSLTHRELELILEILKPLSLRLTPENQRILDERPPNYKNYSTSKILGTLPEQRKAKPTNYPVLGTGFIAQNKNKHRCKLLILLRN